MDDHEDPIESRLKDLRLARQRAMADLERARADIDRIDFAIAVLQDPGFTKPPTAHVQQTKDGHIRNLGTHIVETLRGRGQVMTASELAVELYAPEMPMTPEQFRRRISVKTSAMYKNIRPPELIDSGLKNERREIRWALPEWINEGGKLDLERVPDGAI